MSDCVECGSDGLTSCAKGGVRLVDSWHRFKQNIDYVQTICTEDSKTVMLKPHTNNSSMVISIEGAPVELTPSDVIRLHNADEFEMSEGTRLNYRSQWNRWCEWAEYRGIRELPAAPDMVRAYLAERAELGHKPSTLRLAAAAIARIHSERELPNPITERVRNTLRSLANQYGRGHKQAQALTAEGMAAVRVTACLPRPGRGGRVENAANARLRGLVDIAMLSLMRDALLRIGEAAALRWEDLEDWPTGTGRLTIRRSKTDREGKGAVAFVSRRTMVDLAAIRNGTGPTDSIYGLSARQMRNRIRAAAEAAGLGDGFSGHSARVGMAQDLVRVGTELTALMNAGRWRSHGMPAHYTRNQEAARGAVARYYNES